ncbi:helix-turn-helix transcriptional regulator [Marinobacterium lutimaris]|uniref:AraC-type DNA-binding protein n=1 Tax=Marinobacterium lutimaris TaxID=568106 RepID=A0A1H6BHT3_9GAMM|nr:helix-turn-helix transcriptional regulator [Marinobacterium lutimaris]SEG60204.1 AraC-type DNA-binding protein [Marinobacterium lutimaris]
MQPGALEAVRSFRESDFLEFGREYGIDYRFHDRCLSNGSIVQAELNPVIAQGRIDEVVLPSGFRFTESELELFQTYSSASHGHAPLLMVIVLTGEVELSVGALSHKLSAGQALSLQLSPEFALEATQTGGQKLHSLTLAVDPGSAAVGSALTTSMNSILQGIYNRALAWSVPESLLAQLYNCCELNRPDIQRQLLLEGLALQLIAYGLPEAAYQPPSVGPASQRDYQRLEAVRQQLEFEPTREYTLDGLAQQAAMSASSLRSKFRSAYGISVFDYLRRCRLELGRRYLEQGFSVQQAAHRAGYRHATNFSTAFRREFGVSPRAVI